MHVRQVWAEDLQGELVILVPFDDQVPHVVDDADVFGWEMTHQLLCQGGAGAN